uniref:Insulin-like domain-containing protein n=1 Tax=Clytia hemisphaerica TaxID=252671 RepID=A0A7M5X128_9CNID
MNLYENKKVLMAFTTCVLLSMWLPMVSATREMKPKDAVKLCGQDFIKVWTTICKLKQMKNARGRKRRSIEEPSSLLKLRTIDLKEELIAPENAKQFLKSLHSRRRRRSLTGDLDNGNEECCNESCTFGEIAEYSC